MELATVLKLLVTAMMVIILLLTSHRGAAVHGSISLMKDNGTTTPTNIICTGECVVADQYAVPEHYMMAYETSRILVKGGPITPGALDAKFHASCGRGSWATCAGLQTKAPPGEKCNIGANYNRICHKANN